MSMPTHVKDKKGVEYLIADLRDEQGRTYDPNMHIGTNGIPRVKLGGKLWMKSAQHRKEKLEKIEKEKAELHEEQKQKQAQEQQFEQEKARKEAEKLEEENKAESRKLTNKATAKVATKMFIQAGVAFAGSSFIPRNDAEKQMLETTFDDYFEATGGLDLPPWLALSMGLGTYTIGHIPAVPEKNTWWERLKNKATVWRAKSIVKKAEAEAAKKDKKDDR